MKGLISLLVVAGVLVLVIGFFVILYNRLVASREKVRSAWSSIDVLLKRRHDLIPNLVETVKGYAAHERQTLEAVIAARNVAVTSAGGREGDHARQVQAEGQLSGALRQIFALAESYPQLKADTGFVQLQNELSDTENRISNQRQAYNGDVRDYNTALQTIPTNLVAGLFGFTAEPFFEVQNPAERDVPKVQF